MKRSRRILASIIGLGLGLAGCDTVPTATSSSGQLPRVGSLLVHDIALLALGLGFAVAIVLLVSIIGQAIGHWRLSVRLQVAAHVAVIAGHSVRVVPGSRIALVVGIRRPATYVSEDVVAALAADELAAVIAHERHHELMRAPVQLIVLAGIAAPFRFVRPVKSWVERACARIEIEADAAALVEGWSRQAIASAIVKLSDGQGAPRFATFASAADLRLRALLDGEHENAPRLRDDLVVGALLAAIAVLACSALMS